MVYRAIGLAAGAACNAFYLGVDGAGGVARILL